MGPTCAVQKRVLEIRFPMQPPVSNLQDYQYHDSDDNC